MTPRIAAHFSSKNFSAWVSFRQPEPSEFVYILKVFNRHSLNSVALKLKFHLFLSKIKFCPHSQFCSIIFLLKNLGCTAFTQILLPPFQILREPAECSHAVLDTLEASVGNLAFNPLSQKRRVKWSKLPGKRFYRLEINSGTQRALH